MDYENGIVGNNNMVIGDYKDIADDFKDKTNVRKPTGEEVSSIMEYAANHTPQGITQYFDFFDNNILNEDFRRLLLAMMLTSLGMAFCGYALHGKR